jgi:IstB-like ATP binding protein
MRGKDEQQLDVFSYISPEQRVPQDHPLRSLRAMTAAAEELLEIIMRRYERASTILTSNRPVEDWGKLLGEAAAVSAMLDRLLHHGHVLKCGPRSWRTKIDLPPQEAAG